MASGTTRGDSINLTALICRRFLEAGPGRLLKTGPEVSSSVAGNDFQSYLVATDSDRCPAMEGRTAGNQMRVTS